MARINIEENWWTDPRRETLSRLLGDELLADGAVIRLWRLGQEYWKSNEPIPNHVFEHVRFGSEIVKCGLAISNEEGVYVRGSSKSFDWLQKRREAASKAGKKSAESRKKTKGTSQPSSNQTRTKRKQTQLELTEINEPEPSYSSSSSSSCSSSESSSSELKNLESFDSPPDDESSSPGESLWSIYEMLWRSKYKVECPRNAKVNSQLSQLSSRIPKQDQMRLIQFYLRHTKPYYVTNMHTVGALLSDCEVLLAQMRAGTTHTNGVHPVSKVTAIHDSNRELINTLIKEGELQS